MTQDRESFFEVTGLVSEEATVVEVYAQPRGASQRVRAVGFSKKHPNDVHNPELAYNLALSRALKNLSEEFNNLAQHEVVKADRAERLLKGNLSYLTFSGANNPLPF